VPTVLTEMAKHKFGKWTYTDEELDRQYEEATRREEEAAAREPRASAARYDGRSRRLVIELTNGAIFIVPIAQLDGFADARPRDIAAVEVMPGGSALHWERLDIDYSVTGLIAGVFGTRPWMAELGRKGGRVSSEAKAAAARKNGARGGRPPKPKVPGRRSA
jgi:hypothetical protein